MSRYPCRCSFRGIGVVGLRLATHSGTGALLLPVAVKEQLDHLFLAQTGDPSYHSRLWYRMLYLSATTITTLGPGNIAPVSERARLLVGFEAVFGIVVIGLFLNALAWQVGHAPLANDKRIQIGADRADARVAQAPARAPAAARTARDLASSSRPTQPLRTSSPSTARSANTS
jgi:Ion channel